MGDSTEKNLKSYRNSELKWFLLANILLMLVTSGGLKFDSQDANVFSFTSLDKGTQPFVVCDG